MVLTLLVAVLLAGGYPPPGSQGLNPAHGYSWLCAGAEMDAVCAGHVPKSVRRPLHVPKIAPGAACPVSHWQEFTGPLGPGIGRGPAYAVGFRSDSSLDFMFGDPSLTPPPWRGQKVLWAIAPSYRGPVLIRGHQLDGPWWVGFEYGPPLAELQLPPLRKAEKSRWRDVPSATRIHDAGCYAYQVDGRTFSRVIVFRANVR